MQKNQGAMGGLNQKQQMAAMQRRMQSMGGARRGASGGMPDMVSPLLDLSTRPHANSASERDDEIDGWWKRRRWYARYAKHTFSASLLSTNVFPDMSALQGMLGGAGGAGGMPDM